MPRPVDGELTDETVRLLQKALYVEPLHYPLDPNKIPQNGHEYIHQVRLEELSYFPELANKDSSDSFTICFPETPVLTPKMSLGQWKRREANFFSHLVVQLKSLRGQLLKKYRQKKCPNIGNEKDWCRFCFGSDMSNQIYDGEGPHAEGNPPYLSIVLHLSQEDILALLQFMRKWFNLIGMSHDICRWIYSLLACLLKPLTDNCEDFLETFCDDLVEKAKECQESEKNQLHLITAILKHYFCVKAHEIGPSLEKFSKLC